MTPLRAAATLVDRDTSEKKYILLSAKLAAQATAIASVAVHNTEVGDGFIQRDGGAPQKFFRSLKLNLVLDYPILFSPLLY